MRTREENYKGFINTKVTEGAKTAEQLYQEMKARNKAIEIAKQEELEDKLFRKCGLEGDVLSKLARIKEDADEGYSEMAHLLAILNSIIRHEEFASERFVEVLSNYLETNTSDNYYIIDNKTMKRLLDLEDNTKVECAVIDAEGDIDKTVNRFKAELLVQRIRTDLQDYYKNNLQFLLDIYSNSALRVDGYWYDENRNYCYKDGKYYLNQFTELKELNYDEL